MLPQSTIDQLTTTAKRMVKSGKGILAADESVKTIDKRFAPISLANTPENRHNFREMLLTTKGMGEYISGVILFDETIRESVEGKTFVAILQNEGVLPGIKVDEGLMDMPTSPTEKITKGLDGLGEQLEEYKKLGAMFCKWRCVITIGDTTPTDENMLQNAKDMAAYTTLCQEKGLVPMVEPEILIDGNHTRQQAKQASEKMLAVLFEQLQKADAVLEGAILKTSMVISGKESGEKETPDDIAKDTIELFKKILPPSLAGVVFLSGGQKEIQATENLNAMHLLRPLPWPVTFSYSRALEESAIITWQGKKEHIPAAQKVFLHRAKMNSLASLGKYRQDMEKEL